MRRASPALLFRLEPFSYSIATGSFNWPRAAECSSTDLRVADNIARRIMIIVGEPSGDELGAQLIVALKKISGSSISLTGVGGPAMIAEGFQPLFNIDTTSVIG